MGVVAMRKIHFVKMHGAGNDFVMIDDRAGDFPADDYMRVAAMATRRYGIGCEGVILVQKSDVADFRMRFFNPDGSEAELCGNGARCVAAFAREIGAAKSDRMTFETIAGTIAAEIVDASLVRIAMPQPRDFGDDFVVEGVPHKIVVVENLAKTDVETEGRRIRMSSEFAPAGTNVDFVVYRSPNRVTIRTYERGVEDYGLEFPVQVKTAQGYELVVDGAFTGDAFSSLTLTGPVKRVYEGSIDWDSLDVVSE